MAMKYCKKHKVWHTDGNGCTACNIASQKPQLRRISAYGNGWDGSNKVEEQKVKEGAK